VLWRLAHALAMGATGLFSGLLAGLLGVGAGIVIVPVLFTVFPLFGIPQGVQMKLAVGSSIAIVIFTCIVSARKHFANGTMDVALLRSLVPSITFGVLLGTLRGGHVRGGVRTGVVAANAMRVAAKMAFTGVDWRLRDSFPTGKRRHGIGTFIGGTSTMMGIGGGTVGVPILSLFGAPMRSAVATASAFGAIISIPATLGFLYGGWGKPELPPLSLGSVNLQGFALIVLVSLVATPWGVNLAHSIPPLLLKRISAAFLALTMLRMWWSLASRLGPLSGTAAAALCRSGSAASSSSR
jgi:uncharacterized membrane protein YfcA